MARMQVCFVDWPGGMMRHSIRLGCCGAPKVCNIAIDIIDDFDAWLMWPIEQHSSAATERFDVVVRVAQAGPHKGRDRALPTEVRERRFQALTWAALALH